MGPGTFQYQGFVFKVRSLGLGFRVRIRIGFRVRANFRVRVSLRVSVSF